MEVVMEGQTIGSYLPVFLLVVPLIGAVFDLFTTGAAKTGAPSSAWSPSPTTGLSAQRL